MPINLERWDDLNRDKMKRELDAAIDRALGLEPIPCPCCKGLGYLVVWDHKTPISLAEAHEHTCTHCMGKGVVLL